MMFKDNSMLLIHRNVGLICILYRQNGTEISLAVYHESKLFKVKMLNFIVSL